MFLTEEDASNTFKNRFVHPNRRYSQSAPEPSRYYPQDEDDKNG